MPVVLALSMRLVVGVCVSVGVLWIWWNDFDFGWDTPKWRRIKVVVVESLYSYEAAFDAAGRTYIRPQTHKHDHRSIHTYKGQSSINPWPQPAICSGASRDWKSRKPPAVLQSSRPSWKRPIQSTCRIVPRGRREAILSYQWEVIRSLLVLRSAVALGRT